MKPCLDCGALLSRGTRCPGCQGAKDRRRPSPSRRGHGRDYRKARAELIGEPCELRYPGCERVATTADYVVPVSRGGTLEDGLRPACLHCNSVRGNRRGGGEGVPREIRATAGYPVLPVRERYS